MNKTTSLIFSLLCATLVVIDYCFDHITIWTFVNLFAAGINLYVFASKEEDNHES